MTLRRVHAGPRCAVEFASPAALPWVPADKHITSSSLTASASGKSFVIQASFMGHSPATLGGLSLYTDNCLHCAGAVLLITPDRPVHT